MKLLWDAPEDQAQIFSLKQMWLINYRIDPKGQSESFPVTPKKNPALLPVTESSYFNA